MTRSTIHCRCSRPPAWGAREAPHGSVKAINPALALRDGRRSMDLSESIALSEVDPITPLGSAPDADAGPEHVARAMARQRARNPGVPDHRSALSRYFAGAAGVR